MTRQDVINFNNTLIRSHSNYYIIDYIKHIIICIKELLLYINQDDCCIPHTLLVKYEILSAPQR